MTWWYWILFGLGLLIIELFIPSGFFIFFFGVGALITGALTATGLIEDPTFQWILCTTLSIILALSCRRFLMGKWVSPASFNNNPEGREVEVIEEALVAGTGSCEYRGSRWTIRNVGSTALLKGDRAVVESREGFTLVVRKVS